MHRYLIIPLCWIIFALYWLVTSQKVKPSEWRQGIGTELVHRIPLLLGYALMFGMPAYLHARSTSLYAAVGGVICVLGLAAAIWSRRTLAGNWSSDVTLKVDHELVERGPYRFVRHPIYTSILIMSIGSVVAFPHLYSVLGLALVFVAFWLKLKQEEVVMLNHFGPKYEDYRRRVKALIPAVL